MSMHRMKCRSQQCAFEGMMEAKAEQTFNEALMSYPNYLHAFAGLGQVSWAQGKTEQAIEYYKKAVASVPLPQYLTALGDLYTVAGDNAAAKEQYDTVLYIYQVFEAGGVNVDIEKAGFLVDHDMEITTAVKMAEAATSVRQDVNSLDILAWSYYKDGQYDKALATTEKSMRLGTQNAGFYYHLGMIQKALGNDTEGNANIEKAVAINPHFSILHAATATELVRK